MIPAAFDYIRAGSVDEAIAGLAEHGDERAPSVSQEVAGLGQGPAGVAVGAGGLPVLLVGRGIREEEEEKF